MAAGNWRPRGPITDRRLLLFATLAVAAIITHFLTSNLLTNVDPLRVSHFTRARYLRNAIQCAKSGGGLICQGRWLLMAQ